ncbi:MAG: hypothetical protein HY897_03560 [Deltaproteobacteria bacterium]|nr:hypothetical protein [Deltaproteobacteria bacterium]
MGIPAINVVCLRCQSCGEHLAGRDFDRVFFCPACRRAFEAGPTGLEELEFREAGGTGGADADELFLPMWMFDVDVQAARASDEQRTRAAGFFGRVKVFVSAFRLSHKGFYGDPGVALTRHWYLKVKPGEAPEPALEKTVGVIPPGCTVGSSRAMQYAEPVLLLVIDPVVDVTGLELKMAFEKKTLLSVRFHRNDRRVKCLDLAEEYPEHAFPDLVCSADK